LCGTSHESHQKLHGEQRPAQANTRSAQVEASIPSSIGIALPEEDNKSKRGDLQQVHSQVESVGTSSRSTENKRISLQHPKLGRHRTLRLHPNRGHQNTDEPRGGNILPIPGLDKLREDIPRPETALRAAQRTLQ